MANETISILGAQEQLAQGAPTTTETITITLTAADGTTSTQTVAPGETFNIPDGSTVTVDANGLVLDVAVDADGNITFTDPANGNVFALGGLGSQLTSETSTLSLFNNTTGGSEDVAIADILTGIQTAAGGGVATGGGTGDDGSVEILTIGASGDGLGAGPGAGSGSGGGTGAGGGGDDEVIPLDAPGTTLPAGVFPGDVDPSTLNGSNGFVINGVRTGDDAGFSVSNAGDVNGDGIDDFIIGAKDVRSTGDDNGAAYVVFGGTEKFGSVFELSSLAAGDGSSGTVLNGIRSDDYAGFSVSAAGDINGDGIDDLVIGAPYGAGDCGCAGEAYVVFGSATGFGATFELSTLAAGGGADGFVIQGDTPSGQTGFLVSDIGDFNGDGIDDLAVGTPASYGGGPLFSGETYVIFGSNGGFGGTLAVSTLDGTNGVAVIGPDAFAFSGHSVSGAGDINGDGIDDLIIGGPSPFALPGILTGHSSVVFGSNVPFGPTFDMAGLNGTNGFSIAAEVDDLFGESVSGAGDVNGDGIDDLLIGASHADAEAGNAYVVFGTTAGFGATLDATTLDGTNGFQIVGEAAGDHAGLSVSNLGDVNGDGIADFIVAAPYANAYTGSAYVIFGADGLGAGGTFNLATIAAGDGSTGFMLDGIDPADLFGFSVSNAGDVNGDGADDILIGAQDGDPNGNDSGEAYVIFGVPAGGTFVAGTVDDFAGVETPIGGGLVSAVVGDVRANDPDGITVTKVNDSAVGVDSTTTGSFGALSMLADGEFSYQVNGTQAEIVGLSGTEFLLDKFTYETTDGAGNLYTADLTLVMSPASIVSGSAFDDVAIVGTAGDDLIISGGGADSVDGGGGDDRFLILETDVGTDTIINFNTGDLLDLSDLLDTGNVAANMIAFEQDGADVRVIDNTTDGGGATVAVLDTATAANISVDADGVVTTV